MCGEKWSRDHQCKQTVSLHVIQEMVEFFQCTSTEDLLTDEDEEVNPMAISEAVEGKSAHSKAFQLSVVIPRQQRTFLVDSGSTHSFVDTNSASTLAGVQKCMTMKVKVANGGIMSCDSYVPSCQWSVQGVQFEHDLRVLPLSCYDGILGMDWLAKHSPMTVDWEQRWMSFPLHGQSVTIQGAAPIEFPYTIIELSVVTDENAPTLIPEIQELIEEYKDVFAVPVGLPPERACDHAIPLIPGARPFSHRPYRLAP